MEIDLVAILKFCPIFKIAFHRIRNKCIRLSVKCRIAVPSKENSIFLFYRFGQGRIEPGNIFVKISRRIAFERVERHAVPGRRGILDLTRKVRIGIRPDILSPNRAIYPVMQGSRHRTVCKLDFGRGLDSLFFRRFLRIQDKGILYDNRSLVRVEKFLSLRIVAILDSESYMLVDPVKQVIYERPAAVIARRLVEAIQNLRIGFLAVSTIGIDYVCSKNSDNFTSIQTPHRKVGIDYSQILYNRFSVGSCYKIADKADIPCICLVRHVSVQACDNVSVTVERSRETVDGIPRNKICSILVIKVTL